MSHNLKTAIFLAILCTMFLFWINGIGWIMDAISNNLEVDWLNEWVVFIPIIALYFGFSVSFGFRFIVWILKKLGL